MVKRYVEEKAYNTALGKRLRAFRLERGLSQMQLGLIMRVTQQQVLKWEKGINHISPRRLAIIRLRFDISLDEFLPRLIQSPKARLPK